MITTFKVSNFKPNSLLILFLITACFLFGQKRNKLLIIGIDGCRSDALELAKTPTIDSLIANGIFTKTSWHLGKTKSGPGWSSMLTGVWDHKHKVNDNKFTNHNFSTFPFFPEYVKRTNSDFQSLLVVGWEGLFDNASTNGWGKCLFGENDEDCLVKTVNQLQNFDADLVMIHFDAVDFTGHTSGFELNNPKYIKAIEKVDKQIRVLMNALQKRKNFKNENWLILSSTDHGGKGLNHSGSSIQERKIWWLASSPDLPIIEISSDDPGSTYYKELPLKKELSNYSPGIVDIAVTALDHLIPNLTEAQLSEWKLDGKSWLHFNPANLNGTWGEFVVQKEISSNEINIAGKHYKMRQILNFEKR